MTTKNALRLCAFLLAASMAAGCSNQSKSSSANSGATNDMSSTAAAQSESNPGDNIHYPDWASAVVPDYPGGVVEQVLINTGLYQIQTTDDVNTVVAWYKARVSGKWSLDNSDGSNNWTNVAHGVEISIKENTLKVSNNIKTMILLSK